MVKDLSQLDLTNKGDKMTLEQLCEKMMDDWRSGSYTQAYEDADAMLSGSQMKDIFIEEAKKKADVSEPGELAIVCRSP